MNEREIRRIEALEIRLERLEARLAKTLGLGEDQAAKAKRHNEAVEVLLFLNQKAGKGFRFVDTNLKFIEMRLAEGASVQDCKAVIASKIRDWASDPKMREYLRPSTLFNAEKFEAYVGRLTPVDGMSTADCDTVSPPKPDIESVEMT